MGEIADAMLEGEMCATCGVWLEGGGDGIPRYCSDQCDPHFDEDAKPKHDKPFFVIAHPGSIKALPKFLDSVNFHHFDPTCQDKKGNPLIRLKHEAGGRRTHALICVVSHYMLEQTIETITQYLKDKEKQP